MVIGLFSNLIPWIEVQVICYAFALFFSFMGNVLFVTIINSFPSIYISISLLGLVTTWIHLSLPSSSSRHHNKRTLRSIIGFLLGILTLLSIKWSCYSNNPMFLNGTTNSIIIIVVIGVLNGIGGTVYFLEERREIMMRSSLDDEPGRHLI